MASAQVELFPPNPPVLQQPAGGGPFTLIRIERAPDIGGAPGAFVEIGTVAIDVTDEYTYFVDSLGDTTAWYRHRYSDTPNATQSAYSDAIQAGDSVVRQDLRAEITDADITTAMWDRWGRHVLIDLFSAGIWKADVAKITITSTNGVGDEIYGIPAQFRDVIGAEVRDKDGTHRLDRLTDNEEIDLQYANRKLRIFDPVTDGSVTYWIMGKVQYRTLGELTDDFFVLAMHMTLVKYGQFRKHQRQNWKRFLTFDPVTDLGPRDLAAFIAEEKQEVAGRIAALALPEPAIPLPY